MFIFAIHKQINKRMKLNVNAKIISITDVTTTDTGAKWLSFRAETLEDYTQTIEVKIYKKAEYAQHADNFVKFNHVGDEVALELNVECRPYQEKIFTNLSMWRCEKITKDEPQVAAILAAESDDLPF
jgi:hypothetical protein